MTNLLSPAEGQFLLKTARQAIKMTLEGEEILPLNLAEFPLSLQEPGACFVTLLHAGQLRGCVGTIEAVQPLILDVRSRAIAAAFGDPRFPPLTSAELENLEVEISILSKPEPLFYDSPEDLISKLQVGIDGVVLKDGSRRATFLPQVWEKLPDPGLFLSRLCLKLGLVSDAWHSRMLEVEIYQVEKFTEQMLRSE